EKTAAGPALEKHANQRMNTDAITGKELFHAFYNKDSSAKELIDDITSSLVQGIYMINSLLDPHKIVFGGSVITQNPILLELIKDNLDTYLIDEQKHILNNMAISQLGNDQGIIGAGLSVVDAVERKELDKFILSIKCSLQEEMDISRSARVTLPAEEGLEKEISRIVDK